MAGIVTFTEGCYFEFAEDGTLHLVWNNGNALNAVTGASLDYIPSHYHWVAYRENAELHYDFAGQYTLLTENGVGATLAFIVCSMRQILASIRGIQFNLAEMDIRQARNAAGVFPPELIRSLQAHDNEFKSILNQTLSIVVCNGISSVSKGHHYIGNDSMWARLQGATKLNEPFEILNIADWEGAIFHDALHPIDVRWLAEKVCSNDLDDIFKGHINGVALKRLPAIPAGTMMLTVIMAMMRDLEAYSPEIAGKMSRFEEPIKNLMTEIRNAPLDYCTHFQTAQTAENLKKIDAFAPVAAFLYGFLNAAKGDNRAPSSIQSKAIKSIANRNSNPTIMGTQLGATYAGAEISKEKVFEFIETLFNSIVEDHE